MGIEDTVFILMDNQLQQNKLNFASVSVLMVQNKEFFYCVLQVILFEDKFKLLEYPSSKTGISFTERDM